MSKVKVWDINWAETDTTVHGECCFGNILIQKDTNIAYIFGMTGTKKWYPSAQKSLTTPELKLRELKNRINDYHKTRVNYIVGAWLKNEII